MKAIVAADANWGIGYKGQLLKRIPEDMKQFRQKTIGNVVVMGRETFESLPGREPLRDRVNIVLSTNRELVNDGFIVCHSLNELFDELKKHQASDVFIIGGASVYTQLLPFCTEVYVTRFEDAYVADKYLPDLDKDEAWEMETSSEVRSHEDVQFRYVKYINNAAMSVLGG